jgi:YrbI family 3-deoxy-D-manno-octulosonate 8-phosphate phosphatase
MSIDRPLNLEPIRLLLSDVDGILTTGALTFDNNGLESKTFHVRDGMGIKLWQKSGRSFGVITARSSRIVDHRMQELGVKLVQQGSQDKIADAQEILTDMNLTFENVGYIGDDLTDLGLLKRCGFSATVADGVPEVKQAVDYVTTASGGTGAIRELIEMILKSQNQWQQTIQSYTG